MNHGPFQPSGNIPIVGQPFVIKSGFPTLQVVCNCEAHEPILLIGPFVQVCPSCRKGYQILEFKSNLQTGQLGASINVIQPQTDQVKDPQKSGELVEFGARH
jgi:hypothetical protein